MRVCDCDAAEKASHIVVLLLANKRAVCAVFSVRALCTSGDAGAIRSLSRH